MAFDNAGKDLMLDALGSAAVRIHIHEDDPGVGNSNQVGDNETASWDSSSGGEMVLDAAVEFTGLDPEQTVTWFSIWNSGGSTRYGKGEITSGDTSANAAGEFELTTGTKLSLTDPA